MSGKINKPPAPQPTPPRPQSVPPRPATPPTRPPQAMPRPAAAPPPRPQPVQRPVAATVVNRSASVARVQERETRREAVRQIANQTQDRPRPMVRPTAPPQRVMPNRPAPVVSQIPRPVASPAAVKPVQAAPRPAASPPPSAQRIMELRQAAAQARPQVKTPAAPAATFTVNTAAAAPEIAAEISTLNSALTNLQERCSFSRLQSEIMDLDTNLNHALSLLDSARQKGYVFQKDLEELAYGSLDQWQPVRDQALNTIQQQLPIFQSRLYPLSAQIQRVNSGLANPNLARTLISSTQSQVNTLLSDVDRIHSSIQNTYSAVSTNTQNLNSRLTQIHWALTQLDEAKFRMADGESLVMAVAARWDREGNDDPEGILFLSNKRLIFERKEKVATKKVLFISVASELVHEVMIDQPVNSVQDVEAQNKGLFGHQDFINVAFADKKLGKVAFHLNGQDCKGWAAWIKKAKSGEIEQEKAAGGGISIQDISGSVTQADLLAVQNEVNNLQEATTLKDCGQQLAAIENDVRSLERKLANLRARGYVVEKSLEADIAVLASQWDRTKANSQVTLNWQVIQLADQMKWLREELGKLMSMSQNLAAAQPQYMQVKSLIASIEAQADSSEASVQAQYDEYADEVEVMTAHLEWAGWMLDAVETASFKLLATESGVAATEAVHARPGLEAENGVLFLTDQRLLWEDRVGAFELKVEAPIQEVAEVQKEVNEETGQEALIVSFAAGSSYPNARFDLAMPVAEDWLKMIGRARSGSYVQDRAVEIDPAELERIRNAPSKCSNCGAVFTAPVLRGQTEIICEYCSVATKI